MVRVLVFLFSFCVVFSENSSAQLGVAKETFNHQDTLRGSMNSERDWWDVTHYAITVEPNYITHEITGTNILQCVSTRGAQMMQIDMQEPMNITKIVFNEKEVTSKREGNVYHVDLGHVVPPQTKMTLLISFSGHPREAIRPPWDGGWIWKKDKAGNPWMSVACQGLGASVWYPCKDYQGDEPDSASLCMIVPDTLKAVGNGRLRSTVKKPNNTTAYTWAVVNPINNYTIIPYIGKYVNWNEEFNGEKGKLDMGFWALAEDEGAARKQFTQAAEMMQCFEHWMGPYPFYEDSYKLVESPHLGMEHQSATAYGNEFKNGYLGKDLSGTGFGLKWDYIIVHESGHEWFANNITTKDIADMWVHEGFTCYSETLFTECQSGKEAGEKYNQGLRGRISNETPVVGHYGVNKEGSRDMYSKGSNILEMVRKIINDDEKFRLMLRGMNKEFYHQTVTTKDIEDYMSKTAGTDLSKFFDQYLRDPRIPMLEYKTTDGKLQYRFTGCIEGFTMPVKLNTPDTAWIYPTTEWKTSDLKCKFTVDPNFYIGSRKM
jgi:aminopeptidase N